MVLCEVCNRPSSTPRVYDSTSLEDTKICWACRQWEQKHPNEILTKDRPRRSVDPELVQKRKIPPLEAEPKKRYNLRMRTRNMRDLMGDESDDSEMSESEQASEQEPESEQASEHDPELEEESEQTSEQELEEEQEPEKEPEPEETPKRKPARPPVPRRSELKNVNLRLVDPDRPDAAKAPETNGAARQNQVKAEAPRPIPVPQVVSHPPPRNLNPYELQVFKSVAHVNSAFHNYKTVMNRKVLQLQQQVSKYRNANVEVLKKQIALRDAELLQRQRTIQQQAKHLEQYQTTVQQLRRDIALISGKCVQYQSALHATQRFRPY